MQQRQLRLGDIVDDYCPRERRVTNHAIVAMIEQQVKQTRCVTCDAEHEYKAARVPPQRKKKESPAALYKQVLTDAMKPEAAGAVLSRHNGNHDDVRPVVPVDPAPGMPPEAPTEAAAPDDQDTAPEAEPEAPNEEREEEEDGPVHRPLIRATLPRHEGQTPVRKEPEFTFRMTRGGRFRPHAGPGHIRPQGGGHGQTRHAGSRPPQHGARGNRPAQGQGQGPGRPGQRHGHGKKRPK